MKKLRSIKKLCLACMEEHMVDVVEVVENEFFKDEDVSYLALYEYCPNTDEYIETEEMIKANSLVMKDAYREKAGLLTSDEIRNIREKYGLSQKDFSKILDWGEATITRYENHQIQDRVHDDVLRKIDSDPKWFLEILIRSKDKISDKAFKKYYHNANIQFRNKRNQYLIDSIQALYAEYEDDNLTGRTNLNLNKVIDIINYLAQKVINLHMVKLMKMLWYSDYLHYKRNGKAISGLVYIALPMGAVPVGYEKVVSLEGVYFDIVWYGENIAYKFKSIPGYLVKNLTQSEIAAIDRVIDVLGDLNTEEIVAKMHQEVAYKRTNINFPIPFSYAEYISIE
jgi:putative zinc finger/helix-turn-helix YgiT family protein